MKDNIRTLLGLCLVFGIVGAHIFGEIGALIGLFFGGFFGIIFWHSHKWQRRMFYDDQGNPFVMIKFCESQGCNAVEFDGWVKTDG